MNRRIDIESLSIVSAWRARGELLEHVADPHDDDGHEVASERLRGGQRLLRRVGGRRGRRGALHLGPGGGGRGSELDAVVLVRLARHLLTGRSLAAGSGLGVRLAA